MADRNSDLVSLLRQCMTTFAETVQDFESLATEFELRISKGKFADFKDGDLPSGHTDITRAELTEAVQAVAKILGDITTEQKEAVQLVRL